MTRNPVAGGPLRRARRALLLTAAMLGVLLLAGCGMFGAADEAPTPEAAETRVLVPTFTATPEGQSTPTPQPIVQPVAQLQPMTATQPIAQPVTQPITQPVTQTAGLSAGLAGAISAGSSVMTAASLAASVAPTPTAAPRARLTIEQDLINVRTGPGTNYGTGGSAAKGESFDIIGKNEAGDWWLVCCVAGEPVWVFGQLGRAENAESVPVATPAAVAAAPQAPAPQPAATQAPAAPAATDTPAPAAPPADDPCAGIGGDGCKFKLKAGPAFAPNGGGELKLTLGFIHSGVEGGQPQGSYFVVLLKDGQNLNVPDSVRSMDPSVGMRDGPNGKYNYEYKLGLDQLPGGTVAGNYTIWVLDGNGERDSQNFNFTVPDGQGEVYILFDQA